MLPKHRFGPALFRSCCSCIVLAMAANTASADVSPWALWKPGDGWVIEVEYFPLPNSGAASAAKAKYSLHVAVQAEETIERIPCWRLAFMSASPDAAAVVPKRYRVFVRKDNGRPIVVSLDNKRITEPMLSFGDQKFITLFPKGVPLEIFPFQKVNEEVRLEGSAGILQLSTKEAGGEETLEAIIFLAGQPDVTIRQTWAPGEKWWNRYERLRGDHKELIAHRVVPVAAKEVPQKAKELSKTASMPPPTIMAANELDTDPFNLRKDPALAIGVTWTQTKPTAREVLERIQSASGLTMTASEERILDQQAFEHLNLNSYPCWALMTKVARMNDFRGRWVRTDTGYHLEDATAEPPSYFGRKQIMWAVGASLPVLVAAFLVLTTVRKRWVKPNP